MAILMRDSLAWSARPGGCHVRAFGTPDRWCVAASDGDGWWTDGPVSVDPEVIEPPKQLPPQVPKSLARNLARVGVVVRWRSADLWEALSAAIIQQYARPDDARQAFGRLCDMHGRSIATPEYGDVRSVPDAWLVVGLSNAQFDELGLRWKQPALQSAAAYYIEFGAKWAEMSSERLAKELQVVPEVDAWIAGAAVADYTHDWSVYPVGHARFRDLATAACPEISWAERGDAFAQQWHRIGRGHVGALTFLTLAWQLTR